MESDHIINPREREIEERKERLREFVRLNYRNYYGHAIFVPTQSHNEFTHDANMLWLIKNNIEVGMTL